MGCRLRERARPNRLRAFLREFGARLCYWGQPRPPSTLLWLCVPTRRPFFATLSLSPFYSLALSLPPCAHVAPLPISPTRIPSVTILLYFPATLRCLSFFRARCRPPSLCLFFSSLFGTLRSTSFFLLLQCRQRSLYLVFLAHLVYPFHLISRLALSLWPRGASSRHLFPRERFHPPRRPSRSDAFDHSWGYPIVRRVSSFPRFSLSLSLLLPPDISPTRRASLSRS